MGLPDAIIAMDLTISRSNRALRVATHGNGFYETKLPEPQEVLPIPEPITLLQNYPNPFNAQTQIDYFVEEDSQVTLTIYNTLGQEINRLVDENISQGWHSITWDGKNDKGLIQTSGIYFYQLDASKNMLRRSLIFLK